MTRVTLTLLIDAYIEKRKTDAFFNFSGSWHNSNLSIALLLNSIFLVYLHLFATILRFSSSIRIKTSNNWIYFQIDFSCQLLHDDFELYILWCTGRGSIDIEKDIIVQRYINEPGRRPIQKVDTAVDVLRCKLNFLVDGWTPPRHEARLSARDEELAQQSSSPQSRQAAARRHYSSIHFTARDG